ncbi:MAG: hypothetical protein ACRC2T_19470 [Thermoguttaceae bacterium]
MSETGILEQCYPNSVYENRTVMFETEKEKIEAFFETKKIPLDIRLQRGGVTVRFSGKSYVIMYKWESIGRQGSTQMLLETAVNGGLQFTLTSPSWQKMTKILAGDDAKAILEFKNDEVRLSDLFDLSQLGKYKLRDELSSDEKGQEYQPLLQTNNLKFVIE